MKKFFLTTFLYFSISVFCIANTFTPILLKGKVDKYAIEMEINSYNIQKESFSGRYRYLSQKKYLNIKGEMMQNCIYIEEFVNDKNTGAFYLEVDKDSLKGCWANEKKSYPVKMKTSKGSLTTLKVKKLEDYAKISGSYGVEWYWVNDFHNSANNPNVEIGFNGGYVLFEELKDGTLKFQLEVICGPTYHLAFAEGIAQKEGDVFVFHSNLTNSEEPCKITFKFSGKSVYAEASSSWECGFGARAYLMHTFMKITDSVVFDENTTLEKIKQKNK